MAGVDVSGLLESLVCGGGRGAVGEISRRLFDVSRWAWVVYSIQFVRWCGSLDCCVSCLKPWYILECPLWRLTAHADGQLRRGPAFWMTMCCPQSEEKTWREPIQGRKRKRLEILIIKRINPIMVTRKKKKNPGHISRPPIRYDAWYSGAGWDMRCRW